MKHIPLDKFIFDRLNFYNPLLLNKIIKEHMNHASECEEEEE